MKLVISMLSVMLWLHLYFRPGTSCRLECIVEFPRSEWGSLVQPDVFGHYYKLNGSDLLLDSASLDFGLVRIKLLQH